MLYSTDIINRIITAVEENGFHVSQVNFPVGGGWLIKLRSKGGLLAGVPIIQLDSQSENIRISRRYLISQKVVCEIELAKVADTPELNEEILSKLAVRKTRLAVNPPQLTRQQSDGVAAK